MSLEPGFLLSRLQKRQSDGLLRVLQRPSGLIDLTSNDYFGFAKNPPPVNQHRSYGTGSTGSRLLTGHTSFYEELEEKIARFHRAQSCLICTSGYTANLGLLAALGRSEATFLYDVAIHASMIDGMGLSDAKKIPFRHNDLNSLERRLKKADPPVFVLIESVYSISGTLAPLASIAALCLQYRAALIVDEAHATGIYGSQGEGLVAHLELEHLSFARVHTFSKALGCHGACILGSQRLKQYLINFSRPLIYTTALPPSTLFHIDANYERLKTESTLHQNRLKILMAYFHQRLGIAGSQSPIQPLLIPGVDKVRALSKKLQEKGLDVRAIVHPTVPRGKECLRVVLHSFNQESDVDQLMEVF